MCVSSCHLDRLGSSILLGDEGSGSYTLPTLPAHWVFISGVGLTSQLSSGALDGEYPFKCAPGVLGDSMSPEAQAGPQCARPCPAGHHCGPASRVPSVWYCPHDLNRSHSSTVVVLRIRTFECF